MGGLSLGFALALEGAEILGLDIGRYAVETYNYNLNRLGAKAIVQDVLEWEPEGEFDVVMGGSPCQPFSLANTRRRGREHPLYPTFPRFFDVVLELEPKLFLLENVKGLLTRTHRHLLEEQLKRVDPRYEVRYSVLNAAHYGVPQRRERLFVLGVRRDLRAVPSFPPPTHAEREITTLSGGRLHRWVTVRDAIGDLLAIQPNAYPRKLVQADPIPPDHEAMPLTARHVDRIRREREDTTRHYGRMEFPDSLNKPSRTISSHTVEGTKRETIVVPVTEHVGGKVLPPETVARILSSGVGLRVHEPDQPAKTIKGVTGGPQNTEPYLLVTEHEYRETRARFSETSLRKHRPQRLGAPASTIRANFHKVPPDALVETRATYRRLTVRECLRLQSFPDWWSFPPDVTITWKYRLVGEAVCPILAYRLAVHIGKIMGWRVREPPKRDEWQLPYFYKAFADYYGGAFTC